jgi:hypothetical protein
MDEWTGVTHVYVRQLVNGLEVADGNINLNIRDGNVIESVLVVRSFVLVHDVTIGRDGDVSITLIEICGTVDCL